MANELVLPLMGEGVVEAQIGRWLKAVGDQVAEGDPIVEVETDKVTTELESDFSGTLLQILVPEGETAALHQVLALIGAEGETASANGDREAAQQPEPQPEPMSVPQPEPTPVAVAQPVANGGAYNGRISPVVKRMMQQHNLDLSLIAGTGKNGRVTKRDVEAYLEMAEGRGQQKAEGTRQKAEPTPHAVVAPQPTAAMPAPQYDIPDNVDIQPLSTMRRRIAEHMVMSKRESPHATTVFEIDFDAVARHRASQKAAFAQRGAKLTFMAYIGMAVVNGLQQVPNANSQWSDQGIVLHRNVHLGMATAIENGLVVPVIKNADTLNLFGMASTIGQLAQKGRAGKLQTADLQGGTFTITNHGVFGSLFATPIINQPQSGILGVGTIEKRVCVVNNMIAIRPKAYFSFSFDHRILDGADADRFMQVVKQTLEGWS